MKLELNESELQALLSLMNAGVRASGLPVVKSAAVLVQKIEAAIESEKSNVVNFEDDNKAAS